ncbi:hypothetical protein UlMin_041097 [Ulmus minor]
MDFSNNSKNALKWAINNLTDKGDTLFINHISHNTLNESCSLLWSKSGSPLFSLTEFRQPKIMKKHYVPTDINITIVSKLYWGDAMEKTREFKKTKMYIHTKKHSHEKKQKLFFILFFSSSIVCNFVLGKTKTIFFLSFFLENHIFVLSNCSNVLFGPHF